MEGGEGREAVRGEEKGRRKREMEVYMCLDYSSGWLVECGSHVPTQASGLEWLTVYTINDRASYHFHTAFSIGKIRH